MSRLLFAKEGRAKFISHLDLMRTFQRAFIRAGLPIKHTEGFNPHPYMAFALPLSVGTESRCELMDFRLEGEADLAAVPAALNGKMPEGIDVISAYNENTKFKDIKWLDIEGNLFYDNGVCRAGELDALFHRDSLVIEKKTKRSTAAVDIIPLIAAVSFTDRGGGTALMRARLAAQEPSLSPSQLLSAIDQAAPELSPDFASFRRVEVYDRSMAVFR